MADLPPRVGVLIVGAGPAGLSAATTLAAAGVGTLVVDREAEAGGVPRHCAHPPYGLAEFGRILQGPDYARRLVARARAAGVRIATGATVMALRPGPVAVVTTAEGVAEIAAERVILATGARETTRAARLTGGTKPAGVVNTGGLQLLVHKAGKAPFRRPVVVGTELVAFSALLTCRKAGAAPVAMIEPGARPVARWPAALLPKLLGAPLLLSTELVAIEGGARVEGVTVRGPDGALRPLDCDGVILCGRFRPDAALARASGLTLDPLTGGPEVDQFGRGSDPAVFVAGNLLRGVETAGRCWAEGRATARAVLDDLAGRLPPHAVALRLRVEAEGLAWVAPQRLCAGGIARVDLRLSRPRAGILSLQGRGFDLPLGRVAGRPERRMGLDVAIPPGATGDAALAWAAPLS